MLCYVPTLSSHPLVSLLPSVFFSFAGGGEEGRGRISVLHSVILPALILSQVILSFFFTFFNLCLLFSLFCFMSLLILRCFYSFSRNVIWLGIQVSSSSLARNKKRKVESSVRLCDM